jgi:peptidoglycan-N-acetylglucosamine deacetylase
MWRLPAGSGTVALTFDDGPHSETTNILLDTLRDLDIKATFFLVGEQCAENADVLRRLAAEGHLLANHGFSHKYHCALGRATQRSNIVKTEDELKALNLEPVKLFRPPYGSFNPLTRPLLDSLHYQGVLWSLMVWDWHDQSIEKLWKRISLQLHEGAIIVLHDAHQTTHNVIRILPRLAEEVHRRSWRFVLLNTSTPPTKDIL